MDESEIIDLIRKNIKELIVENMIIETTVESDYQGQIDGVSIYTHRVEVSLRYDGEPVWQDSFTLS